MTKLMAALAVFLALVALANPAEAKKRSHHQRAAIATSHCVPDNNGRMTCAALAQRGTEIQTVRWQQPERWSQERRQVADANGNGTVVVGGRPTGCPHRFCGCEASLYLFGKIRPELNLAANWMHKFPRTSPAPGMAAARNGHVMVLMSHVEGTNWLVHDGNSGGGLTREHVRSIAGYVIVNPRAASVAMK